MTARSGGIGDGMHEMMARGGLAGIASVEGVQIYAFGDGSIWLNHVEMINPSRRPPEVDDAE